MSVTNWQILATTLEYTLFHILKRMEAPRSSERDGNNMRRSGHMLGRSGSNRLVSIISKRDKKRRSR